MRGEIRIAFVSISILATIVVAPQAPTLRPYVALDNEYVNVVVEPAAGNMISDSASITGHPFVRVYVPIEPGVPSKVAPRGINHDSIFAMFFEPNQIYGKFGTQIGTFYHIDLKLLPPKSSFHDDAAKIDKGHNELVLENKRVRVVLIHFERGDAGPMVDKRPRVVIAVTDSQAAVTFPDGHSEPREMKAGTVSFGNAGRQATKNTGTTPLENIVVELKSK